MDSDEYDKYIQIFKYKKEIEKIESYIGQHTGMITLIIPEKKQTYQIISTLENEYNTANNIKSRVNRDAVQKSIMTIINKIKLYNKIPFSGLAFFCGYVGDVNNLTQVIHIIEPPKPIDRYSYFCDNKFHTEILHKLIEENDVFGFLIMNGDGYMIATVSGQKKTILYLV